MKLAADKIDPAAPAPTVQDTVNQAASDKTNMAPSIKATNDAAVASAQAAKDARAAATTNATTYSSTNPNNPITHPAATNVASPVIPAGVDQSAKDIVNSFLAQAGMAALTDQVWAQWGQGTTAAQILDYVRSTPEYGTRYPAMKALNARGMNITEGQYSSIEQSYQNQLKAFGIPSGVFDTHAYMGSLISANVTPADLQTRLQDAQDTILSHDPNTIKYAQDQYGLTTGDLMAGYLDPNAALPVIDQRSKAMQIGGAALGSGFQGAGLNGEITQAQADALATQGISKAQALQGFGNLGQQTQLGQNLPGDSSGALTQQQLIDAQFNSNAQSQLALKNLQARRVADYQAGGQMAQDSKGVSGAGVAGLGS